MAEIIIAVAGHLRQDRQIDVLGEIFVQKSNDILDGVIAALPYAMVALVYDQKLIQMGYACTIGTMIFIVIAIITAATFRVTHTNGL